MPGELLLKSPPTGGAVGSDLDENILSRFFIQVEMNAELPDNISIFDPVFSGVYISGRHSYPEHVGGEDQRVTIFIQNHAPAFPVFFSHELLGCSLGGKRLTFRDLQSVKSARDRISSDDEGNHNDSRFKIKQPSGCFSGRIPSSVSAQLPAHSLPLPIGVCPSPWLSMVFDPCLNRVQPVAIRQDLPTVLRLAGILAALLQEMDGRNIMDLIGCRLLHPQLFRRLFTCGL